ncbi:hypothetical protein Kpol_1071p7 [Vanderwaltozyma polyspora DSM 70294]|uniref:Pre-mRNA-processing protein 45 n=1 Tax=Vanderwaltozyma polyspora (strain ATCC 22028 / DSM 70294 / BCRC 21397 / CBS 2163 / NBRC 10782 / NRRL Y-8283 / UCD 57-17) TaxID=436907 RepID=A7TRK2_VANPO|nr:uncharacterized protein Kpol_1071p7 [Vanderwaltozyma polyspora DSM 70294]EDO15100.1 hypothetical protein Kpol_1071p7 [Vanderwaltozyma polyspora DSM 70294]
MSFSSLLPPPKHSNNNNNKSGQKLSNVNEIQVKALLAEKYREKDNEIHKNNVLETMFNGGVSFQDFLPVRQRNFDLSIPLPTQELIDETFRRTKDAFDILLSKKLEKPGNMVISNKIASMSSKVIHKVSNQNTERVITITQHAQDPLQPVTFKAKKVVAPPVESTQVPIFHKTDANVAESKKISDEEREKWNIPSAVSNWKNPKGYAIALDKRVNSGATVETDASKKFSELSSALEIADREAREELKMKAEAKKQLAEQELQEKEMKLRILSNRAREERERQRKSRYQGRITTGDNIDYSEREREDNRRVKKLDTEKALKRSRMSTADRLRELAYAQGRDISDKVILGAAKATETSEITYDSRLFSKAANANAKRSDDQVYENPLFVQQDINNIYRVNASKLDKTINEEKDSDINGSNSSNYSTHGPIEFTAAETDNGNSEGRK